MHTWDEYDSNDNVINMMGGIIEGTPVECQVGDSRPLTPVYSRWEGSEFSENEVEFAEFDPEEVQALLAQGFSLAVPVEPDFSKKSSRKAQRRGYKG